MPRFRVQSRRGRWHSWKLPLTAFIFLGHSIPETQHTLTVSRGTRKSRESPRWRLEHGKARLQPSLPLKTIPRDYSTLLESLDQLPSHCARSKPRYGLAQSRVSHLDNGILVTGSNAELNLTKNRLDGETSKGHHVACGPLTDFLVGGATVLLRLPLIILVCMMARMLFGHTTA
ncbi:hypothetical protein QBC45DRAFT_429216 [Copromyces sp. CBS 386.78]|nr:hypothetical protein QBC45DRAFT_429216 [Copromyces sp. CBS 386.78]